MSCCNKPAANATAVQTVCECSGPGFCKVIGCTLNAHGFKLCKTTRGYAQLWRENPARAPCIDPPKDKSFTLGLGDVVAFLIRVVTFGLLKMCFGCQWRKAWLNRRFQLWPIKGRK